MFKKILRFFQNIITAIRKAFRWLYHNLFLRLWLVFAGLIGISTASSCPCCGQAAAACPAGFSIVAGLAGILALLGVFQKKARALLRKAFPLLTETGSRYVFWGLLALTVIALSVSAFFLIGKPPIEKEWSPAQQKIAKQADCPVQSSPVVSTSPAVKENVTVQHPSAETVQAPSLGTVPPRHPEADFAEGSIPKRQNLRPSAGAQDDEVQKTLERLPNIKVEKPQVQTAPPTPADTTSLPAPVPAAPEKPSKNAEPPQQMRAVINPDGSVETQKDPEGLIRYETWNFIELNDDIYERINAYREKKIEIEGYVYRRKDFEPGYFVTARLYMWCCTFDAAPIGPLCKWDRSSELKDGDWVRIEGTVEPMFFHDTFEDASGDIPLIKVEKVERIPKLENPYVYLRGSRPTPRKEHS
jgi:uncharacterized repeat protein (TIGR03943 family)